MLTIFDAPLAFDEDVDGYLLCLAQSERNPDMQGYAVRLSTFVANVCIAVLITWSEEEVRSSVSLVLLQIATILSCTAVAMARRDLSVSDAHFALTLTVSPLALYFIYSFYRFIRRRPNHLYARLGKSKVIVAILTGILTIWWIVFDLLIYFSDVFEADDCKLTLKGWLLYFTITSMFSLQFAAVLIPFLPIFWVIYFVRHFKDIRAEYKRHQEKPRDTWKRFSWIQRSYLAVKLFIIAQWDVIALSHRWLFFFLIFILYIWWGSSLLLWTTNASEWYHYVIAANYEPYANVPYQNPADFDPLGYGQLLAIAVAIEPLWSVVRLSFLRRHEIGRWIVQFPKSLWNGIVFIFTGKRNPWKVIREKRLSNEPDYRNLIHPDMLESGEVPISSKRSHRMHGESWGSEDAGKAQVAGSPKLEYYDPFLEVATLPYNREKETETVPLHRPHGTGR